MSLKAYSAWKLSSELIILLKSNPAGLDVKAIMTAVNFRKAVGLIKNAVQI